MSLFSRCSPCYVLFLCFRHPLPHAFVDIPLLVTCNKKENFWHTLSLFLVTGLKSEIFALFIVFDLVFLFLDLLCTTPRKAAASHCGEREIFHVAVEQVDQIRPCTNPTPARLHGPVRPYPGIAHFLACRAELFPCTKFPLSRNSKFANNEPYFRDCIIFLQTWLSWRHRLEKIPGTRLLGCPPVA